MTDELEDLLEQLKEQQRQKQRGRGREANKKDRKMVDSVAREKGMNKIQRREFGDYIEDIKRSENRSTNVNFTYSELLELAEEFLDR
jgi:hypothetical protein